MITYNNYRLPPGLEYVGNGFTIRKTAYITRKDSLEFMRALCQHLIAHPDPMIVPVYDFQDLGQRSEHSYMYSYDMKRLGDLTKGEKQSIWEVIRAKGAWASAKTDGVPTADPLHIFKADAKISPEQAWRDYPELMQYLGEIIKQDRYFDLHDENIMRDDDGSYRIIDLEGFLNPPLSLSENKWIIGE